MNANPRIDRPQVPDSYGASVRDYQSEAVLVIRAACLCLDQISL